MTTDKQPKVEKGLIRSFSDPLNAWKDYNHPTDKTKFIRKHSKKDGKDLNPPKEETKDR